MKRLYIIILISILACKNKQYNRNAQLEENSRTTQVYLIDSLGMITLSIPLRYDTSFTWVHHSDCGKPCDEQKYRFQPKILPIIKESGWIWLGEPKDSIDRFTIIHSGYFPFHDWDTTRSAGIHKRIKTELQSDPNNPPLVFDTMQKINDRYFSVFIMEKSDTLQYKKVLAVTTIKSNEIMFQYELLTKKNDSLTKKFVGNSQDLIKTIRIQKGM